MKRSTFNLVAFSLLAFFLHSQEVLADGKDNIKPWILVEYYHRECNVEDWTPMGIKKWKDNNLSNTGDHWETEGQPGFGHKIEPGNNDKMFVISLLKYEHTVDPYTSEEVAFDIYLHHGLKKSEHRSTIYYMNDLDYNAAISVDFNTNPRKEATSVSGADKYLVLEHYIKSSDGETQAGKDGSFVMKFDNSNNGRQKTFTRYILYYQQGFSFAYSSNQWGYVQVKSTTVQNQKNGKLSGNGTSDSPYLIANATELGYFRDMVNYGSNQALFGKLTADIDMDGIDWEPIGRHTEDSKCRKSFSGTLDGGGFVISNLKCSSANDHDGGLVGRSAKGCVVKNIVLHNVDVSAKYRASTIVGFTGGATTVENCGVYGTLNLNYSSSSSFGVGGIGCSNGNYLTVKNSYTSYSSFSDYGSSKTVVTNSYCGEDYEKEAYCGELCFKLNGNQSSANIWYQTIGEDETPLLDNTKSKIVRKTGVVCHNGEFPMKGYGDLTDPFQIAEPDHLKYFGELVNNGYTAICAVMSRDINYSTYNDVEDLVGSAEYPFEGSFDGNGMTLTLDMPTTEDNVGLFRYANNAILGNVCLKGTISGKDNVGALVGVANGAVTISNVMNEATVATSSTSTASAASLVGCVADKGSLYIDNCAFVGKLQGADAKGNGGFIGSLGSNATGSVSNSLFAPEELSAGTDDSYTFIRYSSTNGSKPVLSNCYYTKSFNVPQGTLVTDSNMKSGQLCFWLNGSTNVNADWLQTLGEDEHPVLWSALRVYKSGENTFSNYSAPLPGAGTETDSYLIATADDLETFRDMVNSGQVSICARLTANIDMSDRYWIPIARYMKGDETPLYYSGTFDGDGYVISNLSGFGREDVEMGFFGSTNDNCVIKDLILYNVHFEALHRAAPLVGLAYGNTKIQDCAVTGLVKLICSETHSTAVGGLVNVAASQTVKAANSYTVFDCLSGYTGKLSAENCYSMADKDSLVAHAETGALCYALNGGTGTTHHWRQTLGTHPYPLQREGKKVYKVGDSFTNFAENDNDNYPFDESISSNDFTVISHGGRLFEFVATLGINDGQGWHAYPDMSISYKQEDGTWAAIADLKNINRECLEFEEDWSGEIAPVAGTFINARTCEKQTAVFWIRQGNHTTSKAASLLWLAPEGLENLPKEFLLQSVKDGSLRMTKTVESSQLPTGQNGITVTEPYLDAMNAVPGVQTLMLISIQPVYSVILWDGTDNRFISASSVAEGTQAVSVSLPQTDSYHNMEVLMYSMHVETSSEGISDTTYVTNAVPVKVKPGHRILETKTARNYNHRTKLEWAINAPQDTDMVASDRFLVYRATKEDFSDKSSIGGLTFSDVSTLEEKNDSIFGWFSFQDSTKKVLSTKGQAEGELSYFDDWNLSDNARSILGSYKYPARYLYYQVSRATLSGIWSDFEGFKAQWKVLLTQVLPSVSTVKVEKTENWNNTHKVNLRVTLPNPYPWDVVDAADRDAVRSEAKKQGFNSRMFLWDTKATVKINRYSNEDEWYNGVDEAAKTIIVKGTEVRLDSVTGDYYALVEDIQSLPFTHYYYEAVVDNTDSNYPVCTSKNIPVNSSKEDAEACYSSKLVTVTNFQATRGDYSGQVSLTWEVDDVTGNTMLLEKRVYQKAYEEKPAPGDFVRVNIQGNTAIDGNAAAAVVNEYRLTATTTVRGKAYTNVSYCYGYPACTGSIQGRVKMPNGTAMPGNVKVTVTRTSPKTLKLYDVYTPDSSTLILPAYSEEQRVMTVMTAQDGSFGLDSLVYFGSGMVYEVQAQCDGATFISPTGTSSVISLTLEDTHFDYNNIDFTCNDVARMSGRILYDGSTIPVRDMNFLVNGNLLCNAKGEPVTTDAKGNFSFTVPRMEVSVQAYKPGHTLSGEGYILGGPNRDQRVFVPTQDYDGLTLTDSTRIRLVGRIVAGEEESSCPMAFGLTQNNLADSITVILQLEGDNASYIHFNRMNPDETHKSATFTQQIDLDGNIQETCVTRADFQQKRIVVRADNRTGEFCIDLPPAKYKLSQIYAQGYTTLYSQGEGIQVIDLTDSTFNTVHTYLREKTGGEAELYTTAYCASYNRVYHSPVKLEFVQLNGRELPYYGEQSLSVQTVTGKYNMQLAWYDEDEEAYRYAFDYPLFKGGQYYQFRVKAYEEYSYNNDPLGQLTRVPVGGRTVTVTNGLVSGSEPVEIDLSDSDGDKGTAVFGFIASNTTFNTSDGYSLFNLTGSVDIDGYHYESEPIEAYVTGQRDMGVEVTNALESTPKVIDYIRDPYGSDSYAYRSAGTTYNWSTEYEKDYSEHFNMSLMLGLAILTSTGFGYMEELEFDMPLFNFDMDATTKHTIEQIAGECSITFNEQISTSDDPADVGAMADIYLGYVNTVDMRRTQVISVIDSATYQLFQPAFNSLSMKLVAEGVSSEGTPQYLVVTNGMQPAEGSSRFFAYTQRYIMDILIPNLQTMRDAVLRLAVDRTEAQYRADRTGLTFYYEADGKYNPCYPSNYTVVKDTFEMYNNRIKEWENIIAENERIKYEQLTKTPAKAYSIAGASIEYSEEASSYYRVQSLTGPCTIDMSGGGGAEGSPSERDSSKTRGFTILFNASFNGGNSTEVSGSFSDYECNIAGSGYVLQTANRGYIDMDVYKVADESLFKVDEALKNRINAYEGKSDVDGYTLQSDYSLEMNEENSSVHNYVFVQHGGASRNPWLGPDSTFYYQPDGVPLALSAPTLKIDNPKIYVENPIVNNQPVDEPAVFTIRISNETEMNELAAASLVSSVWLHVEESSNPDGAKISVDGVPLRNCMELYVNPGQTIVKTLEVERGGKPYDYEDICLIVSDDPDYWTLSDEALISVHYVPTASPVNLSQPADNWLMNTMSQTDEEGRYYIPVQIDGFSTTQYDNFDHIELQYKKQTESEDQWVNICSYYADESLYEKASGTKAMIETPGKIGNIRFYGDNDPVEMKYDMRAVAFCRQGTGFVTRSSKVISGTKDTRRPEVFGLPKPSNGILDYDDVISLPFTEPIAYNYLDETVNFSVQGYTNNSDVNNSVALQFNGAFDFQTATKVTRVLNAMDFSVEMMVQIDEPYDPDYPCLFMAVANEFTGSSESAFSFGYMEKDDELMFYLNGTRMRSMPLKATYGIDLHESLTHVGMTYQVADSTVRCFIGEQWLDMRQDLPTKGVTSANGIVSVGFNLKGRMNNIRIWSKALDTYEMTSKYKKKLTANESGLLAYWPADEAQGSIVHDVINGADIYLSSVTWSVPDGFSVKLEGTEMQILSDQALKFNRASSEDWTLSYWFRVDDLQGNQANLFAAGGENLEEKGMGKVRIRFEDGVLYFVSEGNRFAFGDENDLVSSSAWHHLAVAVNHSQNRVSFFIDGEMVNETSAAQVGGMTGSSIVFGSKEMTGNIDQITLWSMALPASYIKSNYNEALLGTEKELLVYMNFEQDVMNPQGSMFTTFSPYNQVINSTTGKIVGDVMVDVPQSAQDGDVSAPVRSSAGIQNLPFTWKSTDNELQLTINEADAVINNQQVNIVVRNVEDLSGNLMSNAQMWSVYVNRNILNWGTQNISVLLPYKSDTTIQTTISNASGRNVSYTIDCPSSFLDFSQIMGTLGPLGMTDFKIKISDGLAPGVYQATVNLIDENNLCSRLTLNITVKANAPQWTVTTSSDYNQTMNVAAVVKKSSSEGWIVDMCDQDIVAAFVDEVCVGKSYLTVDATDNTSYVFMTILGMQSIQGKEVKFRLFDAVAGATCQLETGTTDAQGQWQKTPVTFMSNAIVGADKSLEMRSTTTKYQTISMKKGWNWISFNVIPHNEKGLNNLFENLGTLTPGDMFKHLLEGFAYLQSDYKWESALDEMKILPGNVYQLYAQQEAGIVVPGVAFSGDNRQVTLNFEQSDWAELAYLLEKSQPIRIALSDFVAGSAKAPAGTVIKGYDAFAVACEDGSWFGSLATMRPGEGYFVYRNGLKEKIDIRFTNTESQYATKSLVSEEVGEMPAATHVEAKSSASMPVIAVFADNDWLPGDVLLAIAGGKVVGMSEALTYGSDYRFFLSVHAQDGEKVTFAKERNGEVVAASTKSVIFSGERMAGTLENPYQVDFNGTSSDVIYDVTGVRQHTSEEYLPTDRVFIIGDRKVVRTK